MTAHTDGCGSDVAAYALGALTPGETRAFERHLADCELCQGDLETLRPVVEQLPRAADPVDPPAALKGQIMAVVQAEAKERARAEKRAASQERFGFLRLRPVAALAAACALVLAGIGFTVALSGEDDEPVRTYSASTTVPGAKAELRVRDNEGTLVLRGMPSAPEGRIYQVWVRRGNERPRPTDALFNVANDGRASVEVPGGVDGVSAVLVTDEPRGGSQVPSRVPSMVAELS